MLRDSGGVRTRDGGRAGRSPAVHGETVTDPARLDDELKSVRDRRVAFGPEEFEVGTRSVASSVLNVRGRPVGAVSVTGDARATSRKRLEGDVVGLVTSAAKEIATGYTRRSRATAGTEPVPSNNTHTRVKPGPAGRARGRTVRIRRLAAPPSAKWVSTNTTRCRIKCGTREGSERVSFGSYRSGAPDPGLGSRSAPLLPFPTPDPDDYPISFGSTPPIYHSHVFETSDRPDRPAWPTLAGGRGTFAVTEPGRTRTTERRIGVGIPPRAGRRANRVGYGDRPGDRVVDVRVDRVDRAEPADDGRRPNASMAASGGGFVPRLDSRTKFGGVLRGVGSRRGAAGRDEPPTC